MPPVPTQVTPLSKPKLLIGEGQDEVNFFDAFVKHLGLADVQIEHYGGKGNLGRFLAEFRVRSGNHSVVSLGITRDADANVAAVFQSVTGLLQANGLMVPAALGQFHPGPPRVGIFIMPDNQRPGMLEDLCLAAVQGDGALTCVDEFFLCVSQRVNRQPSNMAKARVHAWLASQLIPDLRLGEAAQSSVWPWNSPAFALLEQFIRGM